MRTIFLFFFLTVFSFSGIQAQEIPKWKITDLESFIAKSEVPLVVNFWATYCMPCLKEIPYFQAVVKKQEDKKVQLLLVSLDFKELYPLMIRSFADKRNFIAPIVWLDETNADYFCPKIDSSWSGVMPATLFINNKIGYRRFAEEEMSEEKFKEEIKKLIGHQ